MTEPLETIFAAIHDTLEQTPPELAADIADRGILLAGGGLLLKGFRGACAQRDRHAGVARRVAAHLRGGGVGPLARGVRRDEPPERRVPGAPGDQAASCGRAAPASPET